MKKISIPADFIKSNILFLKMGVLGSLMAVIADLFLGYFPSGIEGFETPFTVSIDKVFTILTQTSHQRLVYSAYLAAIGIPLGWFGFYFFYKLLVFQKQRSLALITLIIITVGYLSGTLFHVSLSFIATVFREGVDSETIGYFKDFAQPFAYIFLSAIVIVSFLLTYAFLSKKSNMPKWAAFFTPFFIELIVSFATLIMPLTVKTFLIITIYNMSMFLFYGIYLMVFAGKKR